MIAARSPASRERGAPRAAALALLAIALALPVACPPPARAAVPSAAYTRPGTLVTVAPGRRLNLFCLGHGAPTVLFEAGFGATTMAWRHVQDAVAGTTRACSYDRAGYGFSDPASRPSDARDIVDDLHRLVRRAPLATPLVLVGHSDGGLYATLDAETHPDDVAGLVLIDPHFAAFERQIHATQSPAVAAAQRQAANDQIAVQRNCLAAARTGALAAPAMHDSPCLAADGDLDPVLLAEWRRQASGVPYEAANLSEAESTAPRDADTSSRDDDEVSPTSPRFAPLVVRILVEDPDHPFPGMPAAASAAMLELERRDAAALAAQSRHGSWAFVPHAGHDIQDDDPRAVVSAIRAVVDTVRLNR